MHPLLENALGGRPMKLLKERVMDDAVNHKPVNLYVDRRGRRWIAQSRWGMLRERVPESVTFNVIYGDNHVRK